MKRKMLYLPIVIAGACLLVSCSSQKASGGLLYAPKEISKSGPLSENSRTIYRNFVDLVAPNFFKAFAKDSSIAISLPDLFLCYSMMAILSETALQNEYLAQIGAESLLELSSVSEELIPLFCYVSNEEGHDSGAFNLNGLFFDPALHLNESADERFKMIAESFDGYIFNSRPTTDLVDGWIREADEEGYLSEVPVPLIDESTILCTVSSYALFDSFGEDERARLEKIYQEGGNRLEYSLSDGSKKMVDYLSLSSSNSSIEKGEGYIAARGHIDTCSLKAYYPDEGVGLEDLATSIFSDSEKTLESFDKVYLHVPMFEIDSSFSSPASTLLPSFADGVGTGFFEKEPGEHYPSFFAQNNKLTLDYNGFKGASISLAQNPTSTPDIMTTYTLEVDRPFIFEISRQGLPLYYGQVEDPGYPQYQ